MIICSPVRQTPVDSLAFVSVRFVVDGHEIPENMTVTLICTIDRRKDLFVITRKNQRDILWQIFSDKYESASAFTYDILVEVTGDRFRDTPVIYGTLHPVKVDLPAGLYKHLGPLSLPLPAPTEEQAYTIANYLSANTTKSDHYSI